MVFTAAINLSCSCLALISWLQDHLLPCPFKYFTGIDCPGCGFQRAIIALIKGDVHASWAFYPPAIPFLLAILYSIGNKYLKLGNKRDVISKTIYIMAGSIILVSYTVKMWHLYGHSMLSL